MRLVIMQLKRMLLMSIALLGLALLWIPFQAADAKPSHINKQDVYRLLKSNDSDAVRALPLGDREIFLATFAMDQGKTKEALRLLAGQAVKKNRLAALIRAEAYRRQSVQAADRAGHYAHAVNDDISKLKQARIHSGLDEAKERLDIFLVSLNKPKEKVIDAELMQQELMEADLIVPEPILLAQMKPVKSKSEPTIIVFPEPKPRPKPIVIPLAEPVIEQPAVKLKVARLNLVELEADKTAARAEESTAKETAISFTASVHAAIEAWRNDWQSLDHTAYLGHYDKAFKTSKHDYNSWVSYKRRVNGKKSYIKVDVSNVKIIPSLSAELDGGEAALVMFRQKYQSSNYNASSRKQLYMARKGVGQPWLILYEGDAN